jgi:SRSO17 transposase
VSCSRSSLGCFGNAAVRRHGRAYLVGLLSHQERKNSWTLAELAGDVSPDGLQRLLNFSPWDEDACRDALVRYAVRNAGDPAAVLAVDETGFLKKGTRSAGVARMYTGTAGRVENCQVGVFLAYVTPDGSRVLIDRELYLPRKWADDRDRCRAAGIGDEVAFATKPEKARAMIAHAFLAVTARTARQAATPPGLGKKGLSRLWTDLRPAKNIRSASVYQGRNRT